MKKGSSFESYVHFLYDSILNLRDEGIRVSKSTVFRVGDGESYEVDIYYEFIRAGIRHRVAVECKDWSKPMDQGQVLTFHQKLKNIGDEVVGVIASKSGYQLGAINVAKRHGILLLTREDIPTLADLLGMKITAAFLPEDNCVGEPFWYLAERPATDGIPSDNYYSIAEETSSTRALIPLFVSKAHAEVYRRLLKDCEEFRVYGMPQYTLRGFLAFALLRYTPIGIAFDYPDADGKTYMIRTNAEAINRDFLLPPILSSGGSEEATRKTPKPASRVPKRINPY